MNYRMDKYELDTPELKKRTDKNKELYNSYNVSNYDKFDINSNIQVLKNDARSIDVDQIKELLDKKYRDNLPPRKIVEMPEYEEVEVKNDLEDTKEYDLSSILAKVKEEKKIDYDVERLNKTDLSNAIVDRINQKYNNNSKREDDAEIKELINTITSLEIKNQQKNAELLGLSDEEEVTKTNTAIVPAKTVNEDFYTGKLAVTENDFDDFKEIQQDIKSNSIFIKILVFIVILIFIGIGIFVLNSALNLGIFK